MFLFFLPFGFFFMLFVFFIGLELLYKLALIITPILLVGVVILIVWRLARRRTNSS